jgi:predicted flap endonuclease-1-like 5' DNA nuclease
MMNNQKKSKLILWLGILIALISAMFLFFYQLTNKNKKSISTNVDRYIKISSEDKSTELVKVENEQIKSEIVKDNLKEIKGIGPAIETLLNKNNIYTFSDLGSKSVEDLEIILDKKNLRLADPQTWPVQAQQAAKNKIK